MFDYPSEYFVLVCLIVAIISLIGFIVCGIMVKSKQKKQLEISKNLRTVFIIFMVTTILGIYYIVIFSFGRVATLFVLGILAIVHKIKPEWGAFKQIGISLLIIFISFIPVFSVLYADNIVKDRLYEERQQQEQQMAETVSQIEITDGVTIQDAVKAYGYTYVQWSSYYDEYNNIWTIRASCYKDEYNYKDKIVFCFEYDVATNKVEISQVEDVDGTYYSKEKSQIIFNELIDSASINNIN